MKKVIACSLFFLNTLLFATYYSVAKEALDRIEPIVFSFFEMIALLPAAICILILTWPDLNKETIRRGILVGSWLCLALFTIAIALKYTSATSTAFFPALNGLLAAIMAWAFFRQPLSKMTWIAGALTVFGALLLILNSPMGGTRGTIIALLGGVFYTGYVFLSDHQQHEQVSPWPLFGVELLTMAIWASLVALLFGDWASVHPALPKDLLVIAYIAGATTFLPTLITVLVQKHVSPVTVAFIYILEPVLGAVVANLYLHEELALPAYLGGFLVVLGALLNTWGDTRQHNQNRLTGLLLNMFNPRRRSHLLNLIGYPVLICAGFLLLYALGGLPPRALVELMGIWPTLPQYFQNGESASVILLFAQVSCWIIAWITFISIGLLSAYRLAAHLVRGEETTEDVEIAHPYGATHEYAEKDFVGYINYHSYFWNDEPVQEPIQARPLKSQVKQRRTDRLLRLRATGLSMDSTDQFFEQRERVWSQEE